MGDAVWKVMGTGGAIAAGVLANKVLTVLWKKSVGDDPPSNPEAGDVGWGQAIAWSVASGALVGVARLMWRRQAAAYYRKSTGHLPGNLEDVN